jgi:hypothetical protein
MPSTPQPGAAQRIRQRLAEVQQLHDQAAQEGLSSAITAVKQVQASRFEATYADFSNINTHQAAVRFFLDELYGVRDYSVRDQQFSRIASGIERLFPQAVAHVAENVADLHSLTEKLDMDMARCWQQSASITSVPERYLHCWLQVGAPEQRWLQLQRVELLGQSLTRLTHLRTLRLTLRMMRAPARAAGLATLQIMLETGFEAFCRLPDPEAFIQTIVERESRVIEQLFDANHAKSAEWLGQLLAPVQA